MKEEVYLRPLTVEDAAVSWRWRNDDDIWKYTASRPTVLVTEDMEREWATQAISDHTRVNFAICLKQSKRYIGNIYLVNITECKAELGIFIGDKLCRGKGYAQQAIAQLGKIARNNLGITEILIGVNKDNIPALITYLKSGGRFIGPDSWLQLSMELHNGE